MLVLAVFFRVVEKVPCVSCVPHPRNDGWLWGGWVVVVVTVVMAVLVVVVTVVMAVLVVVVTVVMAVLVVVVTVVMAVLVVVVTVVMAVFEF